MLTAFTEKIEETETVHLFETILSESDFVQVPRDKMSAIKFFLLGRNSIFTFGKSAEIWSKILRIEKARDFEDWATDLLSTNMETGCVPNKK